MDIKIIQDIINELEIHHPETLVHMERTAMYSLALARRLNMSPKDKERAYMLGFLHDIGKLKTPKDILNKQEPLTKEELERVKTDIFYGSNLLKFKPGFEEIADLLNYHQEHYDGSGYLGIKGEEIPFVCRITQLADSYDAMRYRKGMKHQDAIIEMRNNAGKQFDPNLVEHFIRAVVKEKLLKLETLENLKED